MPTSRFRPIALRGGSRPGRGVRATLLLAASAPLLAGCAATQLTDRECMARVMYFESNRSSPEGMLAVGTTVMNRLDNPRYPKSVCEVVGQRNQFAPGALEKPMVPRLAARAQEVADRVLAGERHPALGPEAMFFHTTGYTFPYNNMHYVLEAGGNSFYEKRSPAEMAALARATPRAGEGEAPQGGFSDRQAFGRAESPRQDRGGPGFVSTFDPAAAD
ncbi:cell wall hydrolase [Lichenibacterium dinghuense]|uniref:cell wall hydrolase n=1 Tax=Lichenibacterium dinghuense TaxID=2895977 RepID=UPI001F238E72|nr:cell wall hydrolase [Lichenibacterium sp. 6Y81]